MINSLGGLQGPKPSSGNGANPSSDPNSGAIKPAGTQQNANTKQVKVDPWGQGPGKNDSVWNSLKNAGWSNKEIANQGLVKQVAGMNNLKNPNMVRDGQNLSIPTRPGQATPTASAAQPSGSPPPASQAPAVPPSNQAPTPAAVPPVGQTPTPAAAPAPQSPTGAPPAAAAPAAPAPAAAAPAAPAVAPTPSNALSKIPTSMFPAGQSNWKGNVNAGVGFLSTNINLGNMSANRDQNGLTINSPKGTASFMQDPRNPNMINMNLPQMGASTGTVQPTGNGGFSIHTVDGKTMTFNGRGQGGVALGGSGFGMPFTGTMQRQ